MASTNFDDVHEFNEKFGLKTFKTPQWDIFDTDPKLVNFRMDLIREEVRELEEAVAEKSLLKTIDALADIIYVVQGAGSSFGVNLHKMFKHVHESNMSKLCKNEEQAKETVQWYQQQYALGKQPYDTPAYRIGNDDTYYVVYNQSTGKILKSIYYNEVNFVPLLEQDQEL